QAPARIAVHGDEGVGDEDLRVVGHAATIHAQGPAARHLPRPVLHRTESDMGMTVSDQMLQRLHDWGVRRIYGYPGDGINGLMAALDRASERIEFVQARHEELAAF